MKEVTKEEYLSFIGDKDLITELKEPYPYTVTWVTRRGKEPMAKAEYDIEYKLRRYYIKDETENQI